MSRAPKSLAIQGFPTRDAFVCVYPNSSWAEAEYNTNNTLFVHIGVIIQTLSDSG